MVSVVFFIKFRTRNQVLRLQDSLEKLKNIEDLLNEKSDEYFSQAAVAPGKEVMSLNDIGTRKRMLQNEMKCRVNNIASKEDLERVQFQLSPELTEEVLSIVDTDAIMSFSHPIWSSIKREIEVNSPNFFRNLTILSDGHLDESEVNMAMLIKCGFELRVIAKLMNKSKSGLIYNKRKLYKKLIPEGWGEIDEEDFVRKI